MVPVNTQERGSHLLDAALGLLAEEGLTALTMRSVAARAGVSSAQVQYSFRTKAELVAAAFDHAGEQFLASLRSWFAEQLEVLQHGGQVQARLDTAATAAQLLALIDGVTAHCLVLPIEDRPALADRVLGAWIDHLTGRP